MQQRQDPIPPSFKTLKDNCPEHLLYANCSHTNKNDPRHPKITKPLKRKLKFKKKEFKPSESTQKKISQIEKKSQEAKRRTKEKMRLKARKISAFVPSQGYQSMGDAFSKKRLPQSSEFGIKQLDYQKKLAQLKDCLCCKGSYLGCTNNSMCMGLGMCYCKMHFDMENEQPEDEDDSKFNIGNVFPNYSQEFGMFI